jgi:hypothetical protein
MPLRDVEAMMVERLAMDRKEEDVVMKESMLGSDVVR